MSYLAMVLSVGIVAAMICMIRVCFADSKPRFRVRVSVGDSVIETEASTEDEALSLITSLGKRVAQMRDGK